MSEQSIEAVVDSIIEKANQLHSPPEVAQSLLYLTRNEDVDVREIVDCIQHDPAMSAKMLHIVNSSRYGLRTSITSLSQAVALLGQRTVRLLAMTFSFVDAFTTGPAKSLYNDFWRGALTMASGTSRIGRRTMPSAHNDLYTAGLLADVGTLVMAQAEGERYLALYRVHRGARLAEAERSQYGFDHAAVGTRLLEKWQLPRRTLEAIRRHHDDSVTEPIEIATHAGALLAEAIWQKDPSVVAACRNWLEAQFGIDIDGFTDLAIQCREEVMLELEMYGVNIDHSIDCQVLLKQAHRQYLDSSLSLAMDLDSFESVIDGP